MTGYETELAGSVVEAKDKVKVTKTLEFIPATSLEDAKEGKTIRFMHNMDGTIYWIQGILERRMTEYKDAESSGFTKNCFTIGSPNVISHWGEQKPLPETLKINLTPNAAWSVGTGHRNRAC